MTLKKTSGNVFGMLKTERKYLSEYNLKINSVLRFLQLNTVKHYLQNFSCYLSWRWIQIYRQFKRGKYPDFLIIGAPKTGTTSLWAHLKQHPEIEMSPNFTPLDISDKQVKEVNFFNNCQYHRKKKNINWYRKLFNVNNKMQGEATVLYIHFPQIIHGYMPYIKAIYSLRNPIYRAFSAYNHAIQAPMHLRKQWLCEPNGTFKENILTALEMGGFAARQLGAGLYIKHIKKWLEYFSKNQLLILIAEQMQKDMPGTYEKICNFLNVSHYNFKFQMDINKQNYEQLIDKEAISLLTEYYKKSNEELYDFLGYRIAEWENTQYL